MPISYHPPKAQHWGHGVNRLSALDLFDRSEAFLRDHTVAIRTPPLDLTVIWDPDRFRDLSHAVDESPLFLGDEVERTEGPFIGGSLLRRVSRKLEHGSLRAAVEWVESLGAEIGGREGLSRAILFSHAWFRWADASDSGEGPAVPLPDSMLSIQFGRPRFISTAFHFDSADQYRHIKQRLQDQGLVTLSDRHVRPRGAV